MRIWNSIWRLSLTGVGRFRVNVFRQRGEVAMVVRYIKGEIPSIEELKLPKDFRVFGYGITWFGFSCWFYRLW